VINQLAIGVKNPKEDSMQQFVVRKGTHVGRGHLLGLTNRQDASGVYEGECHDQHTVIGVICDGCSEGHASETGATLATGYLIREIYWLLQCGMSPSEIPAVLYARLRDFLGQFLRLYQFNSEADRVNFIKDHLLFTVVGFVVNDSDAVVFIAGDGTLIINDETKFIDAGNKPMYPAYHLVDRTMLEKEAAELPTSFDVYSPNRLDLKRLAIGSDAWSDERTLLTDIWGLKNPAGLQRMLNRLSNQRHFVDDVTIITCEVVNDQPKTEEEL